MISWIHQQSGGITPFISSLLCQTLMSCSVSSSRDPVLLPLPDTSSITAQLPRHLCLPLANGIRKRRHFSLRMRSLSGKLNRLCAYNQPLLHILSGYIKLLGEKNTFVFRKWLTNYLTSVKLKYKDIHKTSLG